MLDLRTLRLRPGDVAHERVRVPLADLELGGERYRVRPRAVEADVEVQAAAGGRYMKLAFDAAVEGPCVRCLDDAVLPVSVRATEYAERGAGPADELGSEYLADDLLDVDAWARDALVFALPEKVLCREDCAGLCEHCGARLEPGVEHACAERLPDDRWAKLRELL